MPASVSGITRIACCGELRDTVRMTATKTAVRTTSAENEWSSWGRTPAAVAPGWFTACWMIVIDETTRTPSVAASPPTIWAST
jgi:hypothetical protein